MNVSEIRKGLQTIGKVGKPVEWPEQHKYMPTVYLRRWPLTFYQRVADLLQSRTTPVQALQNEALVLGLCDKAGTLLYTGDTALEELSAEIPGPPADYLFGELLDYNNFFRAEPPTTEEIAVESGNSKPTENSAS